MEANEWFHGQISRQCAVALLKEDGDYLVRDCISRPGEFVLTCMSSGKVLHFKLNQIEDEENGGCFWQFEGEFFNSIPELIDYHVNSRQPISNGSQAIISKPIKNNVQCSSNNAIYAKLNSDHRSQSSMSGDTGSTVSSNSSSNLIKSGSRASLLKENCKENSPPGKQGELKRFKSLPSGKVRRVKRRAPSPPKNQKPYQCPAKLDATPPTSLSSSSSVTAEAVGKAAITAVSEATQLSLDLESSSTSSNGSSNTKPAAVPIAPASLEQKTSTFIEGVKLRRKRFTHLLQKPNLRQSMHVAAHLQDYLKKANYYGNDALKEDRRRYSMPRLLDDYDDDDEELTVEVTALDFINQSLVRSPSDSSLLYLGQLGLTVSCHHQQQQPPHQPSTSIAASPPANKNNGCSAKSSEEKANRAEVELPLPLPKKRSQGHSLKNVKRPPKPHCEDINSYGQHSDDASTGPLLTEAIYDSLPKPRPCLTEQQIRFNEIYDIPRRLMVPNRPSLAITNHNSFGKEEDPRSMSALGGSTFYQRAHQRKPSDCISVCSMQCRPSHTATSSNNDNKMLIRHRNFGEGLDAQEGEERPPAKPPAIPPKSRNGGSRRYQHQHHHGHRRDSNELYANPKSLLLSSAAMASKEADCISLCSSFSYCSDCTNASTGPADDTLSSLSSSRERLVGGMEAANDMTPFRFSPTSFLSDTLSLPDYDDESQSSFSYLELQSNAEGGCSSSNSRGHQSRTTDGGCSIAAMSSLSSVSSVTLQGDDMSFGYDSTSLPEDPFPQGLPASSASSTIGSPPPSIPDSELESNLGHEEDLQSLPRDEEFDLPNETDSLSSSHRISSSSTTPTTTTTCMVSVLEPSEEISAGDVLVNLATTPCLDKRTPSADDSEPKDEPLGKAEEEEEGGEDHQPCSDDSSAKELKKQLSVDIFNHRSASRGSMYPKTSYCKSQDGPHYFTSTNNTPSRCKSQPQLLDVDESPVWMMTNDKNNHHKQAQMTRKSLSPSLLASTRSASPISSSSAVTSSTPVAEDKLSVFDPTCFHTLFLPGGGNGSTKPLDPLALNSIHRTLLDTPAPILAVHMTQMDLSLFGLSSIRKSTNKRPAGRYLHALTSPTQFHLDVLDRFLCLRTFVEVSVLAASNLGASAKVVAKWVRVAEETRKRLRNYFGFYAVGSAIASSPHLRTWSQLWNRVQEEWPEEWELLHGPIKHKVQKMKTNNDLNGEASLPHIIPLVVTIVDRQQQQSQHHHAQSEEHQEAGSCLNNKVINELRTEVITNAKNGMLCCDFAFYDVHQKQAQLLASMAEVYQKNAELAFRHITNFEDLLLDFFRTEFHLKLLWGSNGAVNYPDNFEERHAKFSKVLSALASICARQH